MYDEEDYLQLSGLQHFAFCRRQWALIHIEQQWKDNMRTTEGEILHERVHDENLSEKRGDLLSVRGLRVFSATLGVSGSCDLVEFRTAEGGAYLHGREGTWQPVPIEYKRGAPKADEVDRLQVCCQAMCLEEMLCCTIEKGYIFYWETRHRECVLFTEELRAKVEALLKEMHSYFDRGYTPKANYSKVCKACSLADICLPAMRRDDTVRSYLKARLTEEGNA